MMNTQYLSQLIALIAFTLIPARTLSTEENPTDLDTLIADLEVITDINSQNGTCPLHPKPADCAEIFENGNKYSGVYEIYPRNRIIPCETLKVYCDMRTDGGGWTVIQRRGDYKRDEDYFFKNWKEYKNGFGSIKEDFWLGNDNIYALTNQKKYSARFDLGTVKGEKAYAHYDNFWIENEEMKYRLYISDYRGTAGDSMAYHDNMSFSTKDKDNDNYAGSCVDEYKGGWWYDRCYTANLNGVYRKGIQVTKIGDFRNFTVWQTWKGNYESLETVEIKIRPKYFENTE